MYTVCRWVIDQWNVKDIGQYYGIGIDIVIVMVRGGGPPRASQSSGSDVLSNFFVNMFMTHNNMLYFLFTYINRLVKLSKYCKNYLIFLLTLQPLTYTL